MYVCVVSVTQCCRVWIVFGIDSSWEQSGEVGVGKGCSVGGEREGGIPVVEVEVVVEVAGAAEAVLLLVVVVGSLSKVPSPDSTELGLSAAIVVVVLARLTVGKVAVY